MTGKSSIAPRLVIFDCDGVLVDSEPIANRILAAALTNAGYACTVAQAVEKFVGRSLPNIITDVETELGRLLPAHFAESLQADTFDAFRRELKPVPGVAAALDRITLRKCVASSGAPEKIRLSLSLTGLDSQFGNSLFSALQVSRGKPHPDLFLFAARSMDTPAAACVVVEDSTPGVQAARAAGMRVLGYRGGDHVGPNHGDRLAAHGAEVFARMADLPRLLSGS